MVRNSAGDRESLLIRGMVPPLSSHLTYRWYPRSRGVYAAVLRALSWAVGSSPLARGLPNWGYTIITTTRIIPARAGFTPTPSSRSSPTGDHPHSCGVYASYVIWRGGRGGSSPLARGLRDRFSRGPRPGGIIPARAGFTDRSSPRPRRSWDHPRSRGVYLQPIQRRGLLAGSSPLARGLPAHRRGPPDGDRIIPARAGFTPAAAGARGQASDHPRSRGVYLRTGQKSGGTAGSSPLARGLRWDNYVTASTKRIIPARAGFTPRPICRSPRR
mgnify:CR=1 FL=1